MTATTMLKQYGFDLVHHDASIKWQNDTTLTVIRHKSKYEIVLIGDDLYLKRMSETLIRRLEEMGYSVNKTVFTFEQREYTI